jgi:hypothetical protein
MAAPERPLLTLMAPRRTPEQGVAALNRRHAVLDVAATLNVAPAPARPPDANAGHEAAQRETWGKVRSYATWTAIWLIATGCVLGLNRDAAALCGTLSYLLGAGAATMVLTLALKAVAVGLGTPSALLQTARSLLACAQFVVSVWTFVETVRTVHTPGCAGSPVRSLAIADVVLTFAPTFLLLLLLLPLLCCAPCLLPLVLLALQASGVSPVTPATDEQICALTQETFQVAPTAPRMGASVPPQMGASAPPEHEAGPECAICLERLRAGDAVRRLPCPARHVFHVPCVDEWLRYNATCPMDRAPVFGRAGPGPVPPV